MIKIDLYVDENSYKVVSIPLIKKLSK